MQIETKNPLIDRSRIPGEIHALPSRGVFYTKGELDDTIKNGELEFFAMTAYDEMTIRSPDLLFSGDAAKRVISRCVPGVLKPERLLQKDIDFIMTVLRKVSYGPELDVEYKHDCANSKSHQYTLQLNEFIQSVKAIDPTTVVSKFTVTLPNGQVVKVMPLRYDFTVRMMQTTMAELSLESRNELVLDAILNVIDQVDEISDKTLICEWLKTIPVGWTKQIETAIQDAQTTWGPDFTVKLKCKDCGGNISVSAPMNPLTFFI